MKKLIFFCSLILILFTNFSLEERKISLFLENKVLHKGKFVLTKAEIFYRYDVGKMVMHYTYPDEYVLITNSQGEAKIYYPAKKQLFIQKNQILSSENDILYYFLSNKQNDLGLKELGCTLKETKIENNLLITTWLPPTAQADKISEIEMAHENYQPIFSSYKTQKNKFLRKIYYSNYFSDSEVSFPTKITEINYLANGDSIISRKTYSNILLGNQANSSYFDFQIPADAQLMKK